MTLERGGVWHFPTEERDALAAVLGNDQPLLAVIHAERQPLSAAIDQLHAEELRTEIGPVRHRLGVYANISKALNRHDGLRLAEARCQRLANPARGPVPVEDAKRRIRRTPNLAKDEQLGVPKHSQIQHQA